MAWRQPGEKPLSEPMMVILPMNICFSRPQWVNSLSRIADTNGEWRRNYINVCICSRQFCSSLNILRYIICHIIYWCLRLSARLQGVVSLLFRELFKIIPRKYTMPEITFMVRISRWNFVRAQSMALGTRTIFQLEIHIRSKISAIHKFRENIWESSRNVSETPPCIFSALGMEILQSCTKP